MILKIVSTLSGGAKGRTVCTNLNNLVAGELETWNVHRITSHEIAVEYSEDRLMSNNEEIVLFPFKLEDNRLEADGKIMVRLWQCD
jgi:hypothetical protein